MVAPPKPPAATAAPFAPPDSAPLGLQTTIVMKNNSAASNSNNINNNKSNNTSHFMDLTDEDIDELMKIVSEMLFLVECAEFCIFFRTYPPHFL